MIALSHLPEVEGRKAQRCPKSCARTLKIEWASQRWCTQSHNARQCQCLPFVLLASWHCGRGVEGLRQTVHSGCEQLCDAEDGGGGPLTP